MAVMLERLASETPPAADVTPHETARVIAALSFDVGGRVGFPHKKLEMLLANTKLRVDRLLRVLEALQVEGAVMKRGARQDAEYWLTQCERKGE